MNEPMIADEKPQTSPWFTRVEGELDYVGRHRDPAAVSAEQPADEPNTVDQDPLAYIAPGDSFLELPPTAPTCGDLNMQAFDGDQTYACARRPHPAHWQHVGVWRGVVKQVWHTTPPAEVDPLGHVQVGDPDPLEDVNGELCKATGPTVFEIADRTIRNSCDRAPHPAHWQHIAVDVDDVVEVWFSADTGTADERATPADQADTVEHVERRLAEHVEAAELDDVDDSFGERAEHVLRAVHAGRRVLRGMLDERRRSAVAEVFTAYGNVPADTVAALPTELLAALERAAIVLGEPIPPATDEAAAAVPQNEFVITTPSGGA